MKELLNALQSQFRTDQLLEDAPLRRYTTFRVGGPADLLVLPESEEQIILALDEASHRGIPTLVMGNGSNLLVRDGGVRGMVLLLGNGFSNVETQENRLWAQAGASLSRVASAAQQAGLSGLEFASGIPGTLGGGCAMNAGAYGGQLSDVLVEARVLVDGKVQVYSRDDMQMGYRTTRPLREGGIVLSATFALRSDDPDVILSRMQELNARRRDKQPLNFPSAGSTFKRPEGHFAGALIEQAGLKGFSIGGAQVSEKHAGFLINTGDATTTDILALMAHVQDAVLRQFGVSLEPEVRIVGEE